MQNKTLFFLSRRHPVHDCENDKTAKVIVSQQSNQFGANNNKGNMQPIVIWALLGLPQPHPCLFSFSMFTLFIYHL